MNSRERVLKALRHEEPDRIPLDSGGCSSTTIGALPYSDLRRHLGVDGDPIAVFDMVQQLAMVEQWYLDRFEVDVIDVTRVFCEDTSDWLAWTLPNGEVAKAPPWVELEQDGRYWVRKAEDGTILGRMPLEDGYFFDQDYWPMADVAPEELGSPEKYLAKTMWTSMARPPMNRSGEPAFFRLLGDAARALHDTTDYALLFTSGVSLFEMAQFLRRTDKLMMDLVTDRRNVERLLDRLLEMSLTTLERQLDAFGPYLHVLKLNDDLGMQDGPLISPRIFREVFLPRYKVMYELIRKKNPDIFILLHSCGSIYPFLGDLIDIGLQVLNPVQTSARDMAPQRLKREFGKYLTFWGGGVDTQHVLPFGTPEDVAWDVEEKMKAFGPGGGFVFNPSHNISPGVPPENILAMFDVFHKLRDYPIGG